MPGLYLGMDVGTSSSKAVLVDSSGKLLRETVREHNVSNPVPSHYEMDAQIWWDEFVSMCRELTDGDASGVTAVGVSGMGPCAGLADADFNPVRPAILYGVDMRATVEIEELNKELGADTVFARCGSYLSTQAVGPKIRWVAKHEPEAFARAKYLFMPASWLVYQLTGEYTLDYQSASQAVPLFDEVTMDWHPEWTKAIAPQMTWPRLQWASDVAGQVNSAAASATGLKVGTPVITGTVDAWAEGISADAHNPGDLMLMYGTTMFLVGTASKALRHPTLWGTVGALPDTFNLAAGMATSGAITNWMRDLFAGADFTQLTKEAAASSPGSRGVLCLPYFAGERTPIADPSARGILAGLTTSHTRGDLYRAALEGTAFGVRHNVEEFEAAGAPVQRVVAVGGGTKGELWTDIVSTVMGREQVVPTYAIGASYGMAYLAAASQESVSIGAWNPPGRISKPDPEYTELYAKLFTHYRQLYENTKEISHYLASLQVAAG